MKIIFKKEDMVEAINIVNKALPNSKQSNILDDIIIETDNKNIYLTATNQETTIKTITQGIIKEEGSIAVEGRFFEQIIKKMPSSDINIEMKADDKYNVTFSYNNNTQKIQASSTESFPRSIKINKDKKIRISEYALKKMLEKTIFAVDRNLKEERKILTGVFFNVNNNKLTLKAIDEEKIAILNQELSEKYDNIETIVPGNTIDKIIKILKGDIENEVNIYFNNKNIAFETNKTTIISNIIEGNYINTDKIINTEYTTKIKIDKNELYESVDRTRNYINEDIKKPVIIDIKNDNMEVKLDSLSGGIKENIKIEKTGNDIMIAFNQNTLLSILNAIEEETVNIYMTTSMHPIFIKDEKETYFYFMIPISF